MPSAVHTNVIGETSNLARITMRNYGTGEPCDISSMKTLDASGDRYLTCLFPNVRPDEDTELATAWTIIGVHERAMPMEYWKHVTSVIKGCLGLTGGHINITIPSCLDQSVGLLTEWLNEFPISADQAHRMFLILDPSYDDCAN